MVVCLTSARFNMKADILRSGTVTESETEPGEWVISHDPDSNEIIRKWVPSETDDPDTPEVEGLESFRCMARGIVGIGVGGAGTTEKFSEVYDSTDYVRIWFSSKVKINRNDRITNIRDRKGNIIWREEERTDDAPTVFNVLGITPIPDPFGMHNESTALLERVEAQ